MVLGKPDNHMQDNEIGPNLTPLTESNSKWIKDLKIKLIEEIIGKSFFYFYFYFF